VKAGREFEKKLSDISIGFLAERRQQFHPVPPTKSETSLLGYAAFVAAFVISSARAEKHCRAMQATVC
jgi:hypothetical protein